MKRQFNSSSPPSSPCSDSQISDEFEPVRKRPRIFVSSPTPPPDSLNDNEQNEEEIVVDEPLVPSVVISEESPLDEDNDIIEIEENQDATLIIVSDSDNDDDQGIDIMDDIIPSVSSVANDSISSSHSVDIEIVHEEFTLMDDDDEDEEQLHIDDEDNQLTNDELIDLTDDGPTSTTTASSSSVLLERKLSIDVQQCPICLETLSHLQRTGVYLIITPCRHVMCTLCSRQLLATSSRCPLCRENVNSRTLMPYCILT